MKLGGIVEIMSGLQLRRGPEIDPAGDFILVQAGDVGDERLRINYEDAPRFTPAKNVDRYRIDKGDVIFMGKGASPFACDVGDPPPNAIAGGSLFILRRKNESIEPEYLAWLLNRPEILRRLAIASGTGVSMPIIRKRDLLNLDLELPPLEQQSMACKILDCARDTRFLMRQLSEEHMILAETVCRQFEKNNAEDDDE